MTNGLHSSSFYRSKSRISYPVSKIESFRECNTRRRFIVITPPINHDIKLYLCTSARPYCERISDAKPFASPSTRASHTVQ